MLTSDSRWFPGLLKGTVKSLRSMGVSYLVGTVPVPTELQLRNGNVRPWNLWVWCSFLFRLSRNRSIWWCLHCSRLQGLHQDVCLTSFANVWLYWTSMIHTALPFRFTALPKGYWQLLNSVWFFLALESEVSTVGTTDTTSTVSARACQDQIKASWLQP